MARLPRVVVAGVAQHVTQRGNARQYLLASDSERMLYLDLLRQAVRGEGLSVMGYCLMSNPVHLVVIPRRAEALAVALRRTVVQEIPTPASTWSGGAGSGQR